MSKSIVARVFGFVIIVALSLSLFYLFSANAQEGQGSGLRITPLRHEYIMAPGDSEAFTIQIKNVSGNPIGVVSEVNDFVPNENGTPQLILEGEPTPFSLKSYVSGVENFTLGVDEEKDITYIVSLPDETPPGALFGAMRYSAVPEDDIDSGTTPVSLAASVASLLLINVEGDVNEVMSLGDLTAIKDGSAGSFFETAPNQVGVTLNNEGNTIIKPFGTVRVTDWGGDVIYEYELNPEQIAGNVLPQSSRQFVEDIEGVGSFGRYTIEANISYGSGGNILAGTTTFWVIPWKIVLAVLAVIIFIIWFLTRGIKIYNRRVVERSKGSSSKK